MTKKSCNIRFFLHLKIRFFGHPNQWPGRTVMIMATMIISPIWSLWPYGHSGHSDIEHWYWCLKKRSDPRNAASKADFALKLILRGKSWKLMRKFFSFINFENPLYFLANKKRFWGSTSHYPSALKFMFLESVGTIEWDPPGC